MHDIKHAQPAMPAGDLHPPAGPRPGLEPGEGLDPDGLPAPRPGRARRGRRRRRWSGEESMPPQERKRLAAMGLRKAYGRIKADFSEAYEHCRNDAQRRALEFAHGAAKSAQQRALQDRMLDDRDGWIGAHEAFRIHRCRADRRLARLVAADAVTRILRRLAEMEAQLAVLAA